MDLIIWKDTFNTGNLRVDNQHKHLVALINELFRNLGGTNKDAVLKNTFTELYDYTISHFTMEETVMREFAYSGFMAHKDQHSQFIIQIRDFKERFMAGEAKVNLEVLNFLKDWLLKHIMHTDRKTFEEIKHQC
jgi:hemerythrin